MSNEHQLTELQRPLDGMTIVSVEQAVAAPFATRQLADLGARVIKIERDSGDFARNYDETVHGHASYFVWLNRTKESVVLDLKSPDGQRALRALVEQADVFVSNLAPGAVDRLGFGAEACHEFNSGLIHASISGYGPGGSYTERKAYDLIIQCEAGFLSVTGTKDNPSKGGVSVADIAAGMYTYSGILAALLQRARTGQGATLEISMLEALGEWMSQTHLYAVYGGRVPNRTGGEHASIAPYGPFPVAEGTVFFGLQNEREWVKFCTQVLERPEMAQDPRFTPNARRVENRLELHRIIRKVTAAITAEELIARLDKIGIANARMRDMLAYDQHPQLKERDRWRAVQLPDGTAHGLLPPSLPVGMEPQWGPVPTIGQHTNAVLTEFLGAPTPTGADAS